MENEFEFSGRVAVITGGASGIGLAAAEAFAHEGCRLVLADIEARPLEAATALLASRGAEVIGVVTDVSRRESMFALADAAWSHFGAVHIVMHNAGVLVHGPTQTTPHQDWLFGLNVNLWGPIHGVEAFAQRMVAQAQGGHHVFTASFAGLVPNVMLGAYNVSKAGVAALADSLRIDLHGTGIGVSLLCPMVVQTNIVNSTRNRPPELGGPVTTSFSEAELAHVGRTLEADQVAKLVVEGIRHNRRYIHTHREAEKPIRSRTDKLLAAFQYAL